ncbi:hypothetical protein V6N13_135311 [Hibiscus sabdariffa]
MRSNWWEDKATSRWRGGPRRHQLHGSAQLHGWSGFGRHQASSRWRGPKKPAAQCLSREVSLRTTVTAINSRISRRSKLQRSSQRMCCWRTTSYLQVVAANLSMVLAATLWNGHRK